MVRWAAISGAQLRGQPADQMVRAGLSGPIQGMRPNPVGSI